MSNVVAQPWGEELRPLRVSPSATSCAASGRRSARRCSTSSATSGSRPPTSPRSRTPSPRSSRTRASSPATCAPTRATSALDPDEVFHRFCQESGFVGNAGGAGDGARRPARRRRSRCAGGFRPDFPIARLAGRRRLPAIPFAAIGSLLVLVALIVGPRLRRLDGAAEHPAGAVRAGRGPAGRGGRGRRRSAAPETAGARGAGADRAREPGRGDRARRPLPPAGARGADPGAARRPDRRARPGPDRPARARDAGCRRPAHGRGRAAASRCRRWSRRSSNGTAAADPQVAAAPERPTLVVVAERAAWVRVYLENGTVHLRAHPREGRDLLAARRASTRR